MTISAYDIECLRSNVIDTLFRIPSKWLVVTHHCWQSRACFLRLFHVTRSLRMKDRTVRKICETDI